MSRVPIKAKKESHIRFLSEWKVRRNLSNAEGESLSSNFRPQILKCFSVDRGFLSNFSALGLELVPRSSWLYMIDAGMKEISASILISTVCDGEEGSCLIYRRVVVGRV